MPKGMGYTPWAAHSLAASRLIPVFPFPYSRNQTKFRNRLYSCWELGAENQKLLSERNVFVCNLRHVRLGSALIHAGGGRGPAAAA
jgi:hypothetical protein